MDDDTRTLIKIDGPNGKDLSYIAVTAGEAQPTDQNCPNCGAVMFEFWLYVWTGNGPSPIYTGMVCSADEGCE